MKVFVIYDNRRPEKHDLFVKELKSQKIDYEIFPAIVLTHSVVESISESFKAVIRKAKEQDLEMVCIMEDDVMFSSPKSWEYFLNNKPEKFDIYIGGTYVMDNRIEYKAPVIKVNNYVGNHCIIVNESYYDMWLQTDSKKHCDTVHECGEFYLCFPFIALQRVGWSANNGTLVDYNSKINKIFFLK